MKFFCTNTRPVNHGFSLMELLLVVLIIGLLMAFIIPKLIALRIEARYEIVRQSCSELSGSVQQWVQKSMLAQDDQRSLAIIADYVATLANREPPDRFTPPVQITGQWIATRLRPNNWNTNRIRHDLDDQRVPIPGRWIAKKRNAPPESVVEDIVPGEKMIKNPFSGKNIFRADNDPLYKKQPIPGAIAFGSLLGPNGSISYGFCFQGRDSTTLEWNKDSTFHARQNLFSAQGLEHCFVFANYR